MSPIEKIISIIHNVDKVDLICRLGLFEMIHQQPDAKDAYHVFKDDPALPFLIGLCLKKENNSKKNATPDQVQSIIDEIEKFFNQYKMGELITSQNNSMKDLVVLDAKLTNMLNQINPQKYPFQQEEFAHAFTKLDNKFFKKFGFSISHIKEFGSFLSKLVEDRVNNQLEYAKKLKETGEGFLNNSNDLKQIQKLYGSTDTFKDFLKFKFIEIMEGNARDYFSIKLNKSVISQKLEDFNSFQKYLQTLSCKFGDQNQDYSEPLDKNKFLSKPFIQLNDEEYVFPKPHYLVYNLQLILENLLQDDRINKTSLWHSYEKIRSNFLETKTFDSFKTIFPKSRIYRNLHYTGDKEGEIDVLVIHDNKIFIIDAKGKTISEQAKRGESKPLEHDLKKLVEKAFCQVKNACKFITSNDIAIFYDKKKNEITKIMNGKNYEFFFIVTTLDSLGMSNSKLKNLQSLGLFSDNQFPWAVTIFDLDIISRHVQYPSIFIHYLKQRIRSQNENTFSAVSDLLYFAYYLKQGNFYIPYAKDGKKYSSMTVTGDWLDPFENHYFFNAESPKLELDADYVELIETLEKFQQPRYTDMVALLLDIPNDVKKQMIKYMKQKIKTVKQKKKVDSFSIHFEDEIDLGLTFLASTTRKEIRDKLFPHCIMRKYHHKLTRYLGLGRDVFDDKWLVNDFFYLENPWEYDSEMDSISKEYFKD